MASITKYVKMLMRKGLKADIKTLDEAEIGLATDTKEVFVGTSAGNVQLAKQSDVEVLKSIAFNVKSYGAKGDGVADDTQAFIDCYADVVAKGRGVVYVPSGKYRLTQTINHRSWLITLGAGRGATNILVDHNGAAFDFVVGDDPGVPLQGADVSFGRMTIKRLNKTNVKIAGNHGLRIHGTFGLSVFQDLQIRDMGDSAILIKDDSNYRGTSPMSFRDVMAKSNLYGYGLEVVSCFADIYLDGFHSWGNAGGFNFDGSTRDTTKANYYPYQVVINNSDSEFAGGYITQAGSTTPTAPICYPVIRARYIRGLIVNGSTLITTKNSGQHVIDLDYVENFKIDGGTTITADGGATSSGIWMGANCQHGNIGNINLYGSDNSQYGIVSAGVKGLFIENPKITGFKYGGDLNLKVLFNAIHTLKVTAGATTTGNISVTVGGVQRTIAVTAGDSIATVMGKISATAFTGYNLTNNASDTVTFTATAIGYKRGIIVNPGSTGVTASTTDVNKGLRKVFVESEDNGGYISSDYTGTIEDAPANYGSKAWVAFKWDSGGSFIDLRDGQNVANPTPVTRLSVGVYRIDFRLPFANTNYGVIPAIGGGTFGQFKYANPTTTSVEVHFANSAGTPYDPDLMTVAIFAR